MELKPCFCGRPLTKLHISDAGQGGKYADVGGDCCGEWGIEFRTNYNKLNSIECYSLAVKAWNDAPRNDYEARIDKLEKVVDSLIETDRGLLVTDSGVEALAELQESD